MKLITYIILTEGKVKLEGIAENLKEIGFKEVAILGEISQLTAKGNDEMAAKAKKIKGVSEVLPAHEDIDIGNPESGITW